MWNSQREEEPYWVYGLMHGHTQMVGVCWVGVCLSGCVSAVGVHSVPKKEHTNTFMKTHPIVPHLSPSIIVSATNPFSPHSGHHKNTTNLLSPLCLTGSLLPHTFKANRHQGLTLFHKHIIFIWPYHTGLIALKITV